jgi:hypothetical protein
MTMSTGKLKKMRGFEGNSRSADLFRRKQAEIDCERCGVMQNNIYCERCGERLDEKLVVWLELNWSTGTYHTEGMVPPEKSQGGFPFGRNCARAVTSHSLKEAHLTCASSKP